MYKHQHQSAKNSAYMESNPIQILRYIVNVMRCRDPGSSVESQQESAQFIIVARKAGHHTMTAVGHCCDKRT